VQNTLNREVMKARLTHGTVKQLCIRVLYEFFGWKSAYDAGDFLSLPEEGGINSSLPTFFDTLLDFSERFVVCR